MWVNNITLERIILFKRILSITVSEKNSKYYVSFYFLMVQVALLAVASQLAELAYVNQVDHLTHQVVTSWTPWKWGTYVFRDDFQTVCHYQRYLVMGIAVEAGWFCHRRRHEQRAINLITVSLLLSPPPQGETATMIHQASVAKPIDEASGIRDLLLRKRIHKIEWMTTMVYRSGKAC